MISRQKPAFFGALAMCAASTISFGQSESHGRKYQPPAATGHIVITIEKSYNGKPMENAAVIFRATRNGREDGNLEIKSNSQGKATMDLLEVGDHVQVQVIANGYATAAQEFDVTEADVNLLIRMQRPREQVSVYEDNTGKASTMQPGIQEPMHTAEARGPKATTAVIRGTLKDEHGARVPGALVRLHPTTGPAPDITAATDAVGNYRMERVPPGSYELQVSASGYALHTRRNVVLSGGENEIYEETLHPATGVEAPSHSALPTPGGGPR